ncbi:MAG: carbohydrate ABC transporter permease [Anaerolineales bacterium]|jgi:ABC-type glycerol-3-phosphate transport system permease component|nr:carbohydrate ABC transporter permease [Anaerolineales bacterium]
MNKTTLPTTRFTSNRKTTQVILYAILLSGAVMAVVPFFWMISTSLMTLGETINRQYLPKIPQFANYVEAWSEAKFDKYFVNSVIITLTTVAGLLVTSVLAAYSFARIKFVGRNLIFALLLATMMIPESVTLIPNFLMVKGSIFPLPGPASWKGSWLNELPALTVPFMANAFSIFLLRQFFVKIPEDYWDAARLDGAGHFKFLMSVVLPMSKAPIMTVLLFSIIGSWNAFLWPLLVTTDPTWRPLMVGLYTFVTEAGPETQLLMAGAVITLVPILILYFLTQKQFTEGIAASGIKG